MYFSEDQISIMSLEEKLEQLFDQGDYGVGSMEELQYTVKTLRSVCVYLAIKLNVSDKELHCLHNSFFETLALNLKSNLSDSDEV